MHWTEEGGAPLLIIKLSGEIDLKHSPKLRELLQGKVANRVPAILLDFADVSYIDSSGLATLVEYYKNSRGFSGQLAVAELSARVRGIFDLVRLGEIFPIYSSVAEGRDALAAATEAREPS
jgi:anti-sigma B factor antagonist